MQINQERVDKIAKKERKELSKLVKSIEINGEENLEKLKDKVTIFLPNHLSHMDYRVLSKIFNDYGLKHPAAIASSHLKRKSTKKIMNEKTGVIFINRELAKQGTKKQRLEEAERKRGDLEEVVNKNYNFLIFVEGGFRKFNGEVMEDFSISYPRDYIREVIKQNKNLENYVICNIAIKYIPHPIEEPYKEKSKYCKEKILNAKSKLDYMLYSRKYFKLDVKAYKRVKRKKEKEIIVKVNIGEPYPLEIFSENGKQFELAKFIKQDVKRLYAEL